MGHSLRYEYIKHAQTTCRQSENIAKSEEKQSVGGEKSPIVKRPGFQRVPGPGEHGSGGVTPSILYKESSARVHAPVHTKGKNPGPKSRQDVSNDPPSAEASLPGMNLLDYR